MARGTVLKHPSKNQTRQSLLKRKREKVQRMQPLLNFGMPLYKLTNARFKRLLLPLMHDQNHF